MSIERVIETGRLRLRPITEADADAIWRIHSDPRTNAFNPAGPMSDPADAAKQARDWSDTWSSGRHGYWALEEPNAPGVVIGFGGIRVVDWRGREVYNLYYRLSPEVWGRGLATDLVRAAVTRWREMGETHPLIAYTTADNLPSQRTASKGGLQRRPELDETTLTYTDVVFALGLDRDLTRA